MVLLSVVKTYVAHMLKHSICCTFTASCVVVVVVVVRPWHPCVVVVVVVVRPKHPCVVVEVVVVTSKLVRTCVVVVVVGKNGKLTTLFVTLFQIQAIILFLLAYSVQLNCLAY